MALGGGKWFAENKRIPGAYIDFEGSDPNSAIYPANGGADPYNPYAFLMYDCGEQPLFYSQYLTCAYYLFISDNFQFDLSFTLDVNTAIGFSFTSIN